jgi:hypothetical protein
LTCPGCNGGGVKAETAEPAAMFAQQDAVQPDLRPGLLHQIRSTSCAPPDWPAL